MTRKNTTLAKILALIIDEIGSKKQIANLEAIQRVENQEWPTLEEVERAYAETVLRHTKGNKQAAARLLNIDRKTLDRMLSRHKLKISRTVTRS